MARHKSLIPKDFDGNYTEDMLTERQKQVLNYIRSYAQSKGYPPSVREICKAVGLSSTASVHNHLHKLQDMKFIQRDSAKPRALELTQDSSWRNKTVVPVPLVGNVTAGIPILADENIEETYPIPLDLIGTDEDVFMLSVQVALIDNEETTVKRYFKDLRSIRLQPENDSYSPIIGGDNIQVMGKVIAVFRML